MHAAVAILTLVGASTAMRDDPPAAPTAPPLRNYVAEWAAAVEAIPESDRAWPLYEEAHSLLKPMADFLPSDVDNGSVFPGDPHWSLLLAWLEANQRVLALVRQGSVRDAVGVTPIFATDRQSEAILDDGRGPLIIDAMVPHLQLMRAVARMLRIEMIVAAGSADIELWTRDLEFLMAMARQVHDEPMVVSQRVSIAIVILALEQIVWMLDAHPELVDAKSLTHIASKLEAVAASKLLRVEAGAERLFATDLFSRIFEPRDTGRLTPGGIKYVAFLAWNMRPDDDGTEPDNVEQTRRDRETAYAVLKGQVACRRDIELMDEQVRGAFDRAWARPLWQFDFSEYQTLCMEMEEAPLRFKPVEVLMLGHKHYWAQESARIALDGCRITVALARYRLKHGGYPQTLEALVPEFLAQMPIDRYSGKPFLYKLTDGKPLLYAAGVDQDDDGGEPMTPKNNPFPDDGWQDLLPAERPSGDWLIWPPRRG